MFVLTIALIFPCQLPTTEMSKQSRAFFEKIVDIKLEKELIVVKIPNGLPAASNLRESALAAFPQVGQVRVETGNGSTSTHRGGSGSVTIRSGREGPENLMLQLQAPAGNELVTLTQQQAGAFSLNVRSDKYTVLYEQARGKCLLQVKGGGDSFSVKKPTFLAILQAEPVRAKKYLLAVLELYFDKSPFLTFSAVPPGKTAIRLRDGAEIFGELDIGELALETSYGRLTIPREELIQVFLPGSDLVQDPASGQELSLGEAKNTETVVVTKRFIPRGRLETSRFRIRTRYGDLDIDAEQVLDVAFGPKEPVPK